MKLLNLLLTRILGSREKFSFEERFTIAFSFYAAIACFVSIFANFYLNIGPGAVLIVFLSFAAYLTNYVIGRILKKSSLAKIFLSVYTIIFCNLYWYTNHGSKGSALGLFLIFFSIVLFIWDNRRIIIHTVIIAANIIFLFILEFQNPHLIPDYINETSRIIDSYFSLIIYLGIFSILATSAKNNYIEQYEKAQHSEQLKSAFLANMSHEIRTPLNAIMGFSELLVRTEQSKENKERFSKIILDNGNYLSKLVSDILDVSLIEAGQMKLEIEKTDLNDLLFKIHQTYESKLKKIDKKKIALVLNIPSVPVYLETDAFRLEQIIHNLVSNAIKFTESGSVVMGYQNKGSYVLFYIEDTGLGIKEEFKQDVFKRFVKQEKPSDKKFESGTGIGLALSKNLVEILGGTIGFDSEYQKGSTFYFSIPFKDYAGY